MCSGPLSTLVRIRMLTNELVKKFIIHNSWIKTHTSCVPSSFEKLFCTRIEKKPPLLRATCFREIRKFQFQIDFLTRTIFLPLFAQVFQTTMVFILLFAVVIVFVGARNCDSGLVNTNGLITIGDYQTTFSLAAGGVVCLHTFFTAPALSTPSTSNFAWSIQPSSPVASNSRLFVGEVPAGNQNGNCNNFADRGNLIVGSPAPYALGKYVQNTSFTASDSQLGMDRSQSALETSHRSRFSARTLSFHARFRHLGLRLVGFKLSRPQLVEVRQRFQQLLCRHVQRRLHKRLPRHQHSTSMMDFTRPLAIRTVSNALCQIRRSV